MTEVGRRMSAMEFPFNAGAVLAARGFDLGHHKMLVSPKSQARFEVLKKEFQTLFHDWGLV